MSRLFMFEKPLGMRDTLPELYEAKHHTRSLISEEMKRWGYQFIETPALEYYDTVGAASAILDQQLFKLLDQQGHTLVLRPDMTSPIARVAASKLLKEDLPLRLAYSADVYRAQQREGGRPAEFEQIGVECIGDSTMSADGEGIALLISTLEEARLEQFQLSVGHIGFIQEFFTDILGTEERVKTLTTFLYEKNYVGYREHVKQLPLSSIDKQRLIDFLSLRGGEEVFDSAFDLLENNKGIEALQELKHLWEILKDYGEIGLRVKFDLTLVSHMSYYTGVLFEAYADQVGFSIASGGRYDKLLSQFGKDAGATGFAIRLDRLIQALESIEDREPMKCIIFSGERRKEAFQLAAEKRKAGNKVVLQDINGVKNIDACTELYEEIMMLVGKAGKESTQ